MPSLLKSAKGKEILKRVTGPLDNIQLESFKSHKLRGLVLLDKYDTGVISTTVPKNKADYLIQYAIIVDKK